MAFSATTQQSVLWAKSMSRVSSIGAEPFCISFPAIPSNAAKPSYTVLLNTAALPLIGGGKQSEVIQLRLPAPQAQIQDALQRLGKQDWKDVAASIQDCAIPWLNHKMYFDGETPQILELSQRLSQITTTSSSRATSSGLLAFGSKTCSSTVLARDIARESSSQLFAARMALYGYVERQSEIHCVSKDMDLQPRKPSYTVLLNTAALPLTGGGKQSEVIRGRLAWFQP